MKVLKQTLEICFVSAFMLLLHGCYPYYALGNNGVDPMVFVKPVYSDSSLVTSYIGGKYTHTTDSAYSHMNEVNHFGQLNWSQTYTAKHYNFSYGAFGYLGSYKVDKLDDFKGNKSYYGGGLSSEFCLNIPLRGADLRLIGMKGSIYYENGDFTRFRRMAFAQHLISGVSASEFAYNLSLTTGCEFKFRQSSLGFDSSMGMTYFMNDPAAFLTFSMNAHYTYERYMAYVLLTESAFGIGEEYAVGFSYRLK